MKQDSEQRRRFLRQTGAVLVFTQPALMFVSRAFAIHHGSVDPESAQAVALEYAAESAKEGQQCSNCALYQSGDDKAGGCPLFQGKKVGAGAWCNAWVAAG